MMAARRVRGKGAYGVVKARYIKNRSAKTGGIVTGDVQRVIFYNTYGNQKNNPERRQRGFIYNQDGEVTTYGAYKAWAMAQALNRKYTYRLIISPKGHLLTDSDFVIAVRAAHEQQQLPSDFRLVVHHDTANSHAHLLFHSDKTLRKKALEDYKAALRSQLISLEEKRTLEKGVTIADVGKTTDRSPTAVNTTQAKSPSGKPPRRRRRRSQSKGRSQGQSKEKGVSL